MVRRRRPGPGAPSVERGSRGRCAARWGPLRERRRRGGRGGPPKGGGPRVSPDARPNPAKAQAQPLWGLFLSIACDRPSLAVWAGAARLEPLACHQTHFSPRVSRCHRAVGFVPGVRSRSFSPVQSDRIWLPGLHLVSDFPCNHSSFPSPSFLPGLPDLL